MARRAKGADEHVSECTSGCLSERAQAAMHGWAAWNGA